MAQFGKLSVPEGTSKCKFPKVALIQYTFDVLQSFYEAARACLLALQA